MNVHQTVSLDSAHLGSDQHQGRLARIDAAAYGVRLTCAYCLLQSVEVSRMASAALARAGSSRMPSFRVELPEDEFEEEAAPVEGIELGPLLGRGSYGRVYLGRWNGQEVAIKVHALPESRNSDIQLMVLCAVPAREAERCSAFACTGF